jgi:hypothetical protein
MIVWSIVDLNIVMLLIIQQEYWIKLNDFHLIIYFIIFILFFDMLPIFNEDEIN